MWCIPKRVIHLTLLSKVIYLISFVHKILNMTWFQWYAEASLDELLLYSFLISVFKRQHFLVWNQLWQKYLHHRNQQILQIRVVFPLPFFSESVVKQLPAQCYLISSHSLFVGKLWPLKGQQVQKFSICQPVEKKFSIYQPV